MSSPGVVLMDRQADGSSSSSSDEEAEKKGDASDDEMDRRKPIKRGSVGRGLNASLMAAVSRAAGGSLRRVLWPALLGPFVVALRVHVHGLFLCSVRAVCLLTLRRGVRPRMAR